MEVKNLNSKAWYRLLKVVYFIAFILVLLTTWVLTYPITQEKINVSRIKCGNGYEFSEVTGNRTREGILIECIKHNQALSEEATSNLVLKKIFDGLVSTKTYTSEELQVIKNAEYTDTIETVARYSTLQRIIEYVVPTLIIVIFFWLVARIVRYIIIGEPIFNSVYQRIKVIRKRKIS